MIKSGLDQVSISSYIVNDASKDIMLVCTFDFDDQMKSFLGSYNDIMHA